MPALSAAQRAALEKIVVLARRHAETVAHKALRALAVDQPEPYAHTSPDQRALRNRLRAKARLLGDTLQANGRQDINHLAYELAYEYWHRMLFAKFLEANHLLIHSEGVAVTMEDCAELAPEEGYADKWTAAAAYASRMLPAIFRPDDPLMQVEFATEDRIQLETLLDGIPNDTFTADDSLGWVYQFWQNEAKTAINAGGDKIDGARLPAVTQLFTEPYMVHFLLDNTLGAWWTSRHPGQTPPVKFEYLRLLDDGTPAAGLFEGWPSRTADLTTLDPCMGSGHFIAALFPVLARLRMHEEGLSADEAADRVIAENLHGLELDPRCTQIAAFNLALTAWKFCGQYKALPAMNLACSGLAPKGKLEDWLKLPAREPDPAKKQRLENGLTEMYQLFRQAPELGSLLDPAAIKPDIFTANFEELQPWLDSALDRENDQDLLERGVLAAGIALAGKLLAQKYTLQITNVPYLARGKQAATLADYCEKNYPDAKGDLATVFLDRMLKTAAPGGTACSVIPQNWLFLTTYKKLRERLLKKFVWNIVVRLGEHAFTS
ncbi:MAG: Eco57I restriction-modification methylase domain-containing protein, partial [Saprospiraceae bacterium]